MIVYRAVRWSREGGRWSQLRRVVSRWKASAWPTVERASERLEARPRSPTCDIHSKCAVVLGHAGDTPTCIRYIYILPIRHHTSTCHHRTTARFPPAGSLRHTRHKALWWRAALPSGQRDPLPFTLPVAGRFRQTAANTPPPSAPPIEPCSHRYQTSLVC